MKLLNWQTPLGQAFRNYIQKFIHPDIEVAVFAKMVDEALRRDHNGRYERYETLEIMLTSNGVKYHHVEQFIEFDSDEDEIRFILQYS